MRNHAEAHDAIAPPDDHRPASDEALLVHALGVTAGAALVVDASLRVVGATPSVARVLGAPIKPGTHVVRALVGTGSELADAFVVDRSVVTTVRAGHTAREIDARVRVAPLRSGRDHVGWLVRLSEEPAIPGSPHRFEALATADPTTARTFAIAELLAECDASVLVTGEMGVGKASLVSAIHARSARRAQPLRVLASATMTPEVLERQLLGVTGAEPAGTVLFDDVTELPHDVQGWLLRALETAHVTPADGGTPRAIDVRTFATSRVPVEREVDRGRFRADLAMRLRTVALELLPLRARPADVALLTETFVAALNERSKRRVTSIAPDAIARLQQHDWPGNVRELHVAIEAAFAVGRGAVLSLADVARSLPPLPGTPPEIALVRPIEPAAATDEATRVRRALERAGGDRARAAALLGMSRTTLWRRLRALGIDR